MCKYILLMYHMQLESAIAGVRGNAGGGGGGGVVDVLVSAGTTLMALLSLRSCAVRWGSRPLAGVAVAVLVFGGV